MQIILNNEIKNFFKRCDRNVQINKNQFLDAYVDDTNLNSLISDLKKHGFQEWNNLQPSDIYLLSKDWNNTPYHTHIDLSKISSKHFSFVKETYDGHYLFNADVIQKDPNKELNDYMKLRAMDQDFAAITLYQDNDVWMIDAPSEAITNDPYAKKAFGNTVTFGLGIGYFLFMASRNENLTSLTVVEKSKEVIELFQREILPQFPTHPVIHIIESDAYAYWNKENLEKYDYIYADIWQSNEGLFAIEKLLERYHPSDEKCDFWIEDSCFETMWYLIYLYFKQLATNHNQQVSQKYKPIYQKIQKHFDALDITISDVSILKDMMYDTYRIRKILSMH